MSLLPLISADKVGARAKNQNLKVRHLEPTPENKELVRRYDALVAEINAIPSRAAGLRMNYRKRDVPMALAKLMAERELKMSLLLEMEKVLFPKNEAL